MKTRANGYDDRNMIGRRVEALRKARGIKQKDFIARLQVAGLDINPTSYSKLEGQTRIATDKEYTWLNRNIGWKELFAPKAKRWKISKALLILFCCY